MSELSVYNVLDADGILNTNFEGYEYREGQLNMALLVERAYKEEKIAVIEAGTGIGKSFAYLVPAFLNALNPGLEQNRTVVATATKNLQMQLYHKDVPTLLKLMNLNIPVALLFGKSNYICKRRLDLLRNEIPLMFEDDTSVYYQFLCFVNEDENGLFFDFKGNLTSDIYQNTCCDADLCQGRKCPFANDCFYNKAKKDARKAKVIITNHHLLFTDAQARFNDGIEYDSDSVLPAFSNLIIDEAHNIESNATDLFSDVYSAYELNKHLYRVVQPRFGNNSLLENLEPYCKQKDLITKILEQAKALMSDAGTLNLHLSNLMGQKSIFSILVEEPKVAYLNDFYMYANLVLDSSKELMKLFRQFGADLRFPEDEENMVVEEYNVLTSRIGAALSCLQAFTDTDKWTDDVHFLKEEKRRSERIEQVCISPLSVAQRLQDTIFSKLKTVVCASATLNLGDDFKYWGSHIGLPVPNKQMLKLCIPSPFDYEHNLLLLAPHDSPQFKESESEKYTNFVTNVSKEAILSSGGGALILFTSNKMMKDCFNVLEKPLKENGINPLVQGSLDRFKLLNQFKHDKDSVLFATNSFWEGVDVPGDSLRLVIITKLPFQAPTEPILKARSRKIEEEGKSSFFELSLPEAIMRLKQGFGRLIRNNTDKGIVLVLDSRLVKKGYGQVMLRALPRSYMPETSLETFSRKIEDFLY